MKAFLVLAHAEPRSFNAAMHDAAAQALRSRGHDVRTSDLHAMNFNPVSDRRNFTSVKDAAYFKQQVEEMHATEVGGFAADVEAEMQKLEWCDLMIWQFPLWWFSVPAILKGWADRVLAMGRTYGGGKMYDTGMFKGKRAMLSVTTGGPEVSYKADGGNGDINGVLRPIQRGILRFVGFDVLAPQLVYGPVRMDDGARKAILEGYAKRLADVQNEKPIDVGIYR